MRRYRKRFSQIIFIIFVICLLLVYTPLQGWLPGKTFVTFSLEYIPKSCYGVPTEKQISDFRENLQSTSRNKQVLLWTLMWRSRTWNQPLGQETFLECPETRCELTADRCLQPVSDAIILYYPNLFFYTTNGLPDSHPSWQKWVVGVFESEANYENPRRGSTSDLDGKINSIFSHRFDADIFMPYSYFFKILGDNPKRLQPIIPRNLSSLSLSRKAQQLIQNYDPEQSTDIFTQPAPPQTDYARSKTKLALWFVSNCKTKGVQKRMELFQELRKYIEVDVYSKPGACSDLGAKSDPCNNDASCSEQLMSSYKFYLSFENTQCNYYMTEKFFNPLKSGAIPVAFGAPLGQYEALAPQNSFLHVENFTSIKALAEYMKHLDQNDQHYNRYLKWRESHVRLKNYYVERNFYCKICSDLWDTQKQPNVYYKFSEWWNKDKNCQ